MSFFENIGKKVADASQKTVQKTKEMSEILRLESLASKEESRIRQLHTGIGELYMELHADDCEESFAGLVNEIKAAQQNIADYRQQVAEIKSAQERAEAEFCAKKCPNCGAPVPDDRRFCSSCGSPIPQDEAAAEPGAVQFCPGCGAQVSADSVFCEKCGTKVQ